MRGHREVLAVALDAHHGVLAQHARLPRRREVMTTIGSSLVAERVGPLTARLLVRRDLVADPLLLARHVLALESHGSEPTRQAATANRSTRSFIGCPEWPLTQSNATSPRSLHQVDERLPQVAVGDRLLGAVGPAALQPAAPPPVAEAVDDVRRVADHQQRPVEGAHRLERRPDLHPLVGGGGLVAGVVGVGAQRPGPASRVPGSRRRHRRCRPRGRRPARAWRVGGVGECAAGSRGHGSRQ